MRRMVEKIMNCYGTPLTLRKDKESFSMKGFLQPSGSKSWQNTEVNFSPLGEIPGGQYLYIGPMVPQAEAGDTLVMWGKSYELRRAETVMFHSQPIYRWGLCVEKGGEDTWGD